MALHTHGGKKTVPRKKASPKRAKPKKKRRAK